MAGLTGIYDPNADDRELGDRLAAMRRALEVMGAPQACALTSAPGFVCASFGHKTGAASIAVDLGRRLRLIFDGELYNRSELRTRLQRSDLDAAAICLELFVNEGESFVRLLNGQFNVVIYDAAAQKVSIATDRFGYRPLFLAQSRGRLLFATAMKAILAVLDSTPAVDGIGLLQTLRGGWMFGDRTWLEGIRVAPPGSWIHADHEHFRGERYYRLRFDGGGAQPQPQDYADELAATLSEAVRRQTSKDESFAIPLSGGLDSRSLLFTALPERPPAVTYTFGRRQSFDASYASQLAAIAGVRHRHFEYPSGYLGQVLDRVVWLTEGLSPFAEATFTSFAFHAQLKDEVEALLYGHCGDCLTGAHLPYSIVVRQSRARLIEATLRQYNRVPDAVLQRVLNDDFYRRYAGSLLDELRVTFAGIEGETLADVIDVWDMENRQRRGTFCSNAVDRYRFEVRAPFLDNDVVDHLRRAPLRRRLSQIAYKTMLVNSLENAAAAPWAYTGKPLSTSLARDIVRQGINYAARRMRAVMKPGAPDPRAFRNLAEDTRNDRVFAVLTAFTDDPRFPSDIFDAAGIREIVDLHRSRRGDFTHLVVMLATFAAAWRLFLFETPAVMPSFGRGPE